MNKTFKVIWNSAKQTCSVVSELSKGHVKSNSTTNHSTLSKIFKLSAVGTLLASVSVFANAESYHAGGAIAPDAKSTNSIAIGEFAKITMDTYDGKRSIAIGSRATAQSDESTVIGSDASSKNSSVSVGAHSNSAEKAVAVGAGTNASGAYSTALGHKAEATTNNAIATGYSAQATGDAAIAHGEVANASGSHSISIGGHSNAIGSQAITLGYKSSASGDNALAAGIGANATGNRSLAAGTTSQASGTNATAVGSDANASGVSALAAGSKAKATANRTVALGTESVASESNTTAVGYKANATAEGTASLGNQANASGRVSTALGNNANASGVSALAAGVYANASGRDAIGVGRSSNASGAYSTAIGSGGIASAQNSIAIGTNATASDSNSVALGSNSVTSAAVGTNEATVNGVTYGGFAGNSPVGTVSVGSAGSERTITNVAAGRISQDSTDAINGSQLHSVLQQNTATINNNIYNNINRLENKMDREDKRLRAGIAGATATAGLPQAYTPGKSMVAAAVGGYRDQSALAVGASRITDNGKVVLKLTGNVNTRGDFGGSVGAGYQW